MACHIALHPEYMSPGGLLSSPCREGLKGRAVQWWSTRTCPDTLAAISGLQGDTSRDRRLAMFFEVNHFLEILFL